MSRVKKEQWIYTAKTAALLIIIGIVAFILFHFPPNEKVQEIINDPWPIIFQGLWHWIT